MTSGILIRFTGKLLAIIAFTFGFTSQVVAQYGAPSVRYKIDIKVESEACKTPVKGIEINASPAVNQSNFSRKHISDENGKITFYFTDWDDYSKWKLKATDIDGKENGQFLETEAILDFEKIKFNKEKYWNQESLEPFIIKMKSIGPPPCEKKKKIRVVELLNDSVIDIPTNEPHTVLKPNAQIELGLKASDIKILVYPNPNDGFFTVEFTGDIKNTPELIFLTSEGKLIFKTKMEQSAVGYQKEINMTELPAAQYLIIVSDGKNKISQKVVIL